MAFSAVRVKPTKSRHRTVADSRIQCLLIFSQHKDPEQLRELFDDEKTMQENVNKLVHILKHRKHVIFFTGAGISTSAGIPDFRGPDGVWTLQAEGRKRTNKTVDTLKAIPTITHMAIKKLVESGLAKFVISQNVDGLHRRSGLAPEMLAELHGNTNLERCEACGKDFLRDYHVRNNPHVHMHYTGRLCPCGGKLIDTIINFGENLPEKELDAAFDHSNNADACIVLGSSLTVTPAATCPKIVAKRGGELVICNLQRTPLDERATLRIFSKTDDLMRRVMEKLEIPIPRFQLHRRVVVKTTVRPSARSWSIQLRAIDTDGTVATIFKEVKFSQGKQQKSSSPVPKRDRFVLTGELEEGRKQKQITFDVELTFFGHYYEPNHHLSINLDLSSAAAKTQEEKKKTRSTHTIDLYYDPQTRKWEQEETEAPAKTTA